MVNKFQLNTQVYLNLDLTKIDYTLTGIQGITLIFQDLKYRFDGGLWNTITGADSTILMLGGLWELFDVIGGVAQTPVSLPSTYTRLEILGTITNFNVGIDYTEPNTIVVRDATLLNPIEINTYVLKGEQHLVTKTSKLTAKYTYFGAFREEIDILNPSFMLESSIVPDFNYVYIPSLSRYYFVVGIKCVRTNVYRIDLKVDVLYTYDTDIRKQNCYVSRNSATYNNMLVDERRPVDDVGSISLYDTSSASYITTNNCINLTIDQSSFNTYNYVVTTICDNVPSSSITPPTYGSFLPNIGAYGSGKLPIALDGSNARLVQIAIAKDSTKSGFFESLIAYPFDVTSITDVTNIDVPVILGYSPYYYIDANDCDFETTLPTTPVKGKYFNDVSLGYGIIADFKIYAPYNNEKRYLSFEPYTTMEMFIPFVGWIKLNCIDVWGSRIVVYYGIDVASGFATAYVRNVDSGRVLYSGSCQIGVKLPLSTTDAEENERQKQNNVSNLALGLISSGISSAIGIATKNPLGVISGVLSVANTIKSYANAENLMFDRGQAYFTSTETGFYTQQNKVYVKATTHAPLSVTESVYQELNGYPLRQYTSLSSITGYTECGDMHYTPDTQTNITKTEIDEIISLARDGIIL